MRWRVRKISASPMRCRKRAAARSCAACCGRSHRGIKRSVIRPRSRICRCCRSSATTRNKNISSPCPRGGRRAPKECGGRGPVLDSAHTSARLIEDAQRQDHAPPAAANRVGGSDARRYDHARGSVGAVEAARRRGIDISSPCPRGGRRAPKECGGRGATLIAAQRRKLL